MDKAYPIQVINLFFQSLMVVFSKPCFSHLEDGYFSEVTYKYKKRFYFLCSIKNGIDSQFANICFKMVAILFVTMETSLVSSTPYSDRQDSHLAG